MGPFCGATDTTVSDSGPPTFKKKKKTVMVNPFLKPN